MHVTWIGDPKEHTIPDKRKKKKEKKENWR